MFSLILNSPLSEMLAPRVPPLDEFIFQWNAFNLFFNQAKNESKELGKYRVESTNLSAKLFKMADILVTEQLKHVKKNKDGSLCATLEYLLQNNILDTLSVFAQADIPLGICPHILMFFVRLINDSKTELIPQANVHTALNKLIITCGKIPAGPYESTEIYFLGSLVDQIFRNPEYIDFFLSDSFLLMNSLLLLLDSPDSQIVKRSGDSIIKLVSVCNQTADTLITERLPFCSKILNQIISSYTDIPRSLNPNEVEVAIFSFQTDSNSTFSNSIRKFLCFLKWYIFFDMLISHLRKESLLSTKLRHHFKLDFLESCILADLSGRGYNSYLDSIDNIFLTTVLVSNCLRNTESFLLFDLISEFLLLPNSTLDSVDTLLLNRCQFESIQSKDQSEDLKAKSLKLFSATLQLYEDIFSRPSSNLVHELIVKYLHNSTESQLKQSYGSEFETTSMMQELESISAQICNLPNVNSLVKLYPLWQLDSPMHLYQTFMATSFSLEESGEKNFPDYEAYIKEAAKGIHVFVTTCLANWNDLERVQPGEAVPEAGFLKMLYDNLQNLCHLPYECKLQVNVVLRFSLWNSPVVV